MVQHTTPPARPPRAAIYCRVSSDRQAEEGVSLEAQQEAGIGGLQKLQREQPEIVEYRLFVDAGYSAFKLGLFDRPAGREMNDWLRPGDHVIMLRMDRGFRSTVDWLATIADWTERKIKLHFLQGSADPSTPDGELLSIMLSAIAQYESRIKSARVREALAWQQANDKYTGGRTKTGYRRKKDGSQVAHAADAALARLVRYYRHCGLSFAACSDRIEQLLARRENRPVQDGIFGAREWSKDRLYRLARNYAEK